MCCLVLKDAVAGSGTRWLPYLVSKPKTKDSVALMSCFSADQSDMVSSRLCYEMCNMLYFDCLNLL